MARMGRLIGRVAVTLIMLAFAVVGARWLWQRYEVAPWTRDGRVRADIVQVSPDINGLVTQVLVRDDQQVRAGQVLFAIDRPRFELALDEAEATIALQKASLDQAARTSRRDHALSDLVTTEQVEEGGAKVEQLKASLDQAIVQRNLARLNLERTVVRATVDGVVTNMELQPGDYAAAGRQVLALVNSDSLYVDGYFEETKLAQIRVGDPALVQIMGVPVVLHGRVESIAAGIEDRERSASSRDLANVNPTFSWVRLAQRIPVRIKLISPPANVRLISGRTATVSIQTPPHRPREGQG
jgi:RND family efflux transporter MFP subunit